MIFQKEVNIYSPKAIIKRFEANETSLSVVKGKIEALISESEITELENEKTTMYSKLANVQLKVDGMVQNYGELSGKYDSVSGQYTELKSKTAEYKSTLDEFSANLAKVTSNLEENYSTTTAMNAAIQEKIDEISLSVSETYATWNMLSNGLNQADLSAQEYADAAKQQAVKMAQESTDELLKKYATVEKMEASIKATADSITSTVSSTYATLSQVGSIEEWKKEASQKITDTAIINTVTASASWKGKADKDELISQINQTAEAVKIQAGKISLEGLVTANNYFKINTNGSFETVKGTIGGWTVATTTLKSKNGNITLDAKNDRITTTTDSKGFKTTIEPGILTTGYIKTTDLYATGGLIQIGPYASGDSYLCIRSPFDTDKTGSGSIELHNLSTVQSGGHIVFASDGKTLARLGSSSRRYKNHVRDINKEDLEGLYKLPTVLFTYKPGYLKKESTIPIPGLYAEDVENYLPLAARYQNGKVEDWAERMIIPYLIKAIQEQHREIEKLKAG